jgi:hypothetical protein
LQAAELFQGIIGTRFKTVLAAEMFVPRFERSKTRKSERDAEKDEKIAERKKKQDKRLKENHNQSKRTILRISVRLATNERATSLDMSACETISTIVSIRMEASK